MDESEAAKFGLLDRWRRAVKKRLDRAERKLSARKGLESVIARLLDRARLGENSKPWSQRKLCQKMGIPESSFRKCRAGRVKPEEWLPKLEAALSKLKPS